MALAIPILFLFVGLMFVLPAQIIGSSDGDPAILGVVALIWIPLFIGVIMLFAR